MNAFSGAMKVAALFSPKIKLGIEGREKLIEKLEAVLPGLINGRPVAWFHAASLGEFEQGRPVMEEFRKEFPGYFILLTFFSPSGYEIRKGYAGADYVCYMPIDTAENADQFVKLVKPEITFFIKYEFWFNHLAALKQSNSYILSFSTIFRPDQIFFKSYGGFYRKMLGYFDHLFVQNQESMKLMQQIGISDSSLAGDTRFDRVKSIASGVRQLPEIEVFLQNSPCLVAGSVWEADMVALIPALNQIEGKLKAIIAPHEIEKNQMESWRKSLNGKSMLYSEYKKLFDDSAEIQPFDYLIIDNIGMLSSLYRYSDIAYIGGSFGSGLHNILEAATFGVPVLFGNKKYGKFQEALDLIDEGSAKAVADTNEIKLYLTEWLNEPSKRKDLGKISKQYVESRTGATALVMQKVRALLDKNIKKS
ncbi:3-deoxy-D-manno-octulosonic acid transferase [Dyadobacter subterraneus]|uniref:3-deoxy-D-manno-octulosonic acid transferase n=1 Tax=Dyadobacter subterraneus TaxID=2773304 RepID=A0ABR9WHZ9_9BACT|nr:glycosyltransferase N-terminal domain-containing protein [Dyadobacter subterraneus]MBE9465125.1 3-deoxy-D-manno-octulosonic acid transferase [Dyadobacter subterraneus]